MNAGVAGGPVAKDPSNDLSRDEQLALGLILSDPTSIVRGAALYPLHQDLVKRGMSDAGATIVLGQLTERGLIEPKDVVSDRGDAQYHTYPAYKVTVPGLDLADTIESIRTFRWAYRYAVTLNGASAANQRFLDMIRRVEGVHESRFLSSEAESTCRVLVGCYSDAMGQIRETARAAGVEIVAVGFI